MSKFNDVMIDIETLGNSNNAVVVSIGAVCMDLERGQLGDTFYTLVDPQSCVDMGLQMDVSTVMWWLGQSDEAREALRASDAGELAITRALVSLQRFVHDNATANVCVWGNGAAFDNVIVRTAYKVCRITPPWEFWGDRCFRTIKAEYPQIPYVKPTLAHHALEDAKAQAAHLIKIYQYKQRMAKLVDAVQLGNTECDDLRDMAQEL